MQTIYLSLDLATKLTGYAIYTPQDNIIVTGLIKSENYHQPIESTLFNCDIYGAMKLNERYTFGIPFIPTKIMILCETSPYGQNAFKFGIVLGQILKAIYYIQVANKIDLEIQLVNITPVSWQSYFWPKNERPRHELEDVKSNRKWLKKMSMERASNRLKESIKQDDIADAFNMLDYYFSKHKGKTILND